MKQNEEINLPENKMPIAPDLPVMIGSQNQTQSLSIPEEIATAWMDSNYIPINSSVHAESLQQEKKESPGWWWTLAESTRRNTLSGQAWEFLSDKVEGRSPYEDIAPPQWTPLNEDAIVGLPPKMAHYVLDAHSPADQSARREKAIEQLRNAELYENGALIPKLIGGGVGMAEAMFLPWYLKAASIEKYASIPQAVLMNMSRQIGAIAVDSVIKNGLEQANAAGGNIQDAATGAFADIAFGSAFVGAIGAGIAARQYAKLHNTRNAMKLSADGYKVDLDVENDIIKGVKVSAMPNVAKSAAETEAAQLYADEIFAKAGFFKDNKFGNSLKKFMAWGPLASPLFKAMASPFSTTQAFFNRFSFTGVMTESELAGFTKERPWTAQEVHSYIMDNARVMGQDVKNLYFKANGINTGSDAANNIKNLKQKLTQNQAISAQDFGAEVSRAVTVKDYKSNWAEVHEAADIINKFYKDMGAKYFEATGKKGNFLTPRNAARYLPHNMNLDMLVEHGDEFVNITANALKKQYETIQEIRRPISVLEAEIESKRVQKASIKDKKSQQAIDREIRKLEMRRQAAESRMHTQLRENEDFHILLQDRNYFDESEREQLNNLLTPMRREEARLVVVNQKIDKLKDYKSSNKSDKKIIKETNEKISALEKEIEEVKTRIEEERQKLEDDAFAGKIDNKFFERDGNEIKFKDPNLKPKFRDIPATDSERIFVANQLLDSYKSQSPQDILMSVFGSQSPGLIRNPAYLKSRTNLIDVAEYNGANGGRVFIDTDVTRTMMNYANSMGKIIGFKKAFPEYADGVGFEGIMRAFKGEYDQKRQKLFEEKDSPKRQKALRNLEKEFKNAQKFMEDTYDVYMGTYDTSRPGTQAFSKIARDLVAARVLGKVPIYQLTELATAVMKQGFVPVMAQGLRPKLKSLNHLLKTGEAEDMKKNAADFLIGLNGVQGGLIGRMNESRSMGYAPVGRITNHILGGTEALANWSSNLFFINQMANFNEQIVAGAFQSEVMRACFEFKAGSISPKLKAKMVRYGVNLERDADKFIEQYKTSGGYEVASGYQTKTHAWSDAEAAYNMRMSVRRAVKDTIVNKNIFTSPYWSNNSIGKMIFMFHGWAYDAFVRYTLPLMQRPQGEQFLNFAMVVGVNMLIPPLSRLANGKEAYTDDKTWLNEVYQGLDYSGILGPYTQMIEALNTGLGSPFSTVTTERSNQRSLFGALGPVAGMMNDAFMSGIALSTGRMTEGNVKRLLRLLPFSSSPLVSAPAAAWINSMELPQRTNQAAPWSIREALLGEE